MDLEIKYNDNNDEFISDINFQMRIQRYIENHFLSCIYNIKAF